MPLTAENGFLPDYMPFRRSSLDQAKLMFINYPNNPTGAVAGSGILSKTVEFAAKHGIVVASDFAYGAIGFDANLQLASFKHRALKR